jgi:hypothetical protein
MKGGRNSALMARISGYVASLRLVSGEGIEPSTSVIWKRQQAKHAYGVDQGDIAGAIAEDVAFLDAHPTRNRRPRA